MYCKQCSHYGENVFLMYRSIISLMCHSIFIVNIKRRPGLMSRGVPLSTYWRSDWLIPGDSQPLDVCSVHHHSTLVRYSVSLVGYGFYGDVLAESERHRWMGPLRYDYSGKFLMHIGFWCLLYYCLHCLLNVNIEKSNSYKLLGFYTFAVWTDCMLYLFWCTWR